MYTVSTFYKFVTLDICFKLKVQLLRFCKQNQIKGTILLAYEGINGSVSATQDKIDLLYAFIKNIIQFSDIKFRQTNCDFVPFKRLRVRLKKEIITFKDNSFDIDIRGEYLDHNEWDDFLARSDTILIDTRNKYEIDIGTFKGAINPHTKNFSKLPKWLDENLKEKDKDQNILMFCTEGIRCEKSTAYLKKQGFNNVYHIKDGIVEYLRQSRNKNKNWQGDCYVFDDRIAVNVNLEPVIDV